MPVSKGILLNLKDAAAPRAPRLAGLPLLLRAVLTAQRAGLEELFIVGGHHPGGLLTRDPRGKLQWHWFPVEEEPDELAALRAVGHRLNEPFVLLFADSIIGPGALEALLHAELNAKLARIAIHAGTAEQLDGASPASGGVSLYLCSAQLLKLAEEAPKELKRVDEFIQWLEGGKADPSLTPGMTTGGTARVDRVEVEGKLWPRTSDKQALRRIEREFAHFNLKPSDGIFARFNKLVVAESLIRLAVRTPATPNFITALGLLFALFSGWAFAEGSYAWSLAGAFLAYVSAIMDHIDGMVARLKFLESEFGVWFESAVDYLSYFCIFVGMAIGLYRETGFAPHLVVGGLFLFGWVLSFVLQSRQRMLISGDNPTDYPNRIHTALEKHNQNLLHWFTRRVYFLVRRAVLPYFILLFCLLDLRVLLLGFVTLGANMVWLMIFYNNRLFRQREHRPAEAD
ncbi:CDP-alcohol phosphatidyltransferase family protein [Acidobacteriia bacterium AH_259_A11_L15]|nr:CDP-alcohol phosphatidyltransferase family protein [Acidobacteriia bacterium AH_259_A11_L15]